MSQNEVSSQAALFRLYQQTMPTELLQNVCKSIAEGLEQLEAALAKLQYDMKPHAFDAEKTAKVQAFMGKAQWLLDRAASFKRQAESALAQLPLPVVNLSDAAARELRDEYKNAFLYQDSLGINRVDEAKLTLVLDTLKSEGNVAAMFAILQAPQNWVGTEMKTRLTQELQLAGNKASASDIQEDLSTAEHLESFYATLHRGLAVEAK
jgi:hypothetical protein